MKVLYIVATKRPKTERYELPLMQCLARIKPPHGVTVRDDIYHSNSLGLPTVYNRAIERNPGFDWYVCVHDDLWINDCLVYDKLASAVADVVGIAGGHGWQCKDPTVPTSWTKAAEKYGASGFVVHAPPCSSVRLRPRESYNYRTYFASNYGLSPACVSTLDGCFLGLSRRAVDMGLRFDEQFKWHFYDMDLCFSARKLRLHCETLPILCTHESVGLGVRSPEFAASQDKFLYKWWRS